MLSAVQARGRARCEGVRCLSRVLPQDQMLAADRRHPQTLRKYVRYEEM